MAADAAPRMKRLTFLLVLAAVAPTTAGLLESVCRQPVSSSSVHGYSVQPLEEDSKAVPLSRYAGKVLLLINTATY